ncbi:unnamed protein product [Paramecium sonneborni]|uniref:Transmembrane protein n=1 Tax=Paramecium sonneborni TaxID=65129 RepID=A0A8S1RKF2_9CILI|nr:unnamed protein product [Paramecium sonneborni]
MPSNPKILLRFMIVAYQLIFVYPTKINAKNKKSIDSEKQIFLMNNDFQDLGFQTIQKLKIFQQLQKMRLVTQLPQSNLKGQNLFKIQRYMELSKLFMRIILKDKNVHQCNSINAIHSKEALKQDITNQQLTHSLLLKIQMVDCYELNELNMIAIQILQISLNQMIRKE